MQAKHLKLSPSGALWHRNIANNTRNSLVAPVREAAGNFDNFAVNVCLIGKHEPFSKRPLSFVQLQ